MKGKNKIVVATLLMAVVLLSVGTIAYFRRVVNGDITAQAGSLILIVNEKNAVLNETFNIELKRSNEENFVMPGDSGTFDINIVSTGSTTDVAATIAFARINLPDNLKFYLDAEHTQEITTKTYVLEYAATMEKTVQIYWYWDGTKDDTNDTLFAGQALTANVSVVAKIANPKLYDILAAKQSTLDTNINYRAEASSANGEGLMMRSGTEDDANPILYYRGNITDNNVIFANLCWKIVRTTETGGVKLLYNGTTVTNADGSLGCNNYMYAECTNATDPCFVSKYNEASDSPVYVGYMYNDTNKYFDASTKKIDTTNYTDHLDDESIDQETGRHTQNKYDSTVKTAVDNWYRTNLLGKTAEELLEDTVWCNDRGVNSLSDTSLIFNGSKRESSNPRTPSLVCTRDVDKFTINKSNGNGDLTYPIGMLTMDEYIFAGIVEAPSHPDYGYPLPGSITYLTITNAYSFSMTPDRYYASDFNIGVIGPASGNENVPIYSPVDENNVVRPAISLSNSATVASGNGAYENPFIIG